MTAAFRCQEGNLTHGPNWGLQSQQTLRPLFGNVKVLSGLGILSPWRAHMAVPSGCPFSQGFIKLCVMDIVFVFHFPALNMRT